MVTTLERSALGDLRSQPQHRLAEVVDVLHESAQGHRDVVVKASDLFMNFDEACLQIGNEALPLQSWALSQLGSKLGIPGNYLVKCREEALELLSINANFWLRQQSGHLMLRLDGNEVRAVLSTRYQSVSNEEVASELARVLPPQTPVRFELTATHFELQVIGDGDGTEDSLHGGLHVTNSEVGCSSVRISSLLFRTICLNGMILGGQQFTWERRHIGRMALQQEIRGEVDRLLGASTETLGQFRATARIHIEGPMEVFRRIVERFKLTVDQRDAIVLAHANEPGSSLFHCLNAVTGAGNNPALPLERRRELQEIGGRLLELSEKGRRWLD
ncbi:MAG: DUF932 domain-containing protein [Planctomycetes bacterium]|nr:DUF932 domain-containing protein [Planctomycetota bacterium]